MRQDYFSQNHYRVLGVDRDATHKTIREAYLRLVKQHHPDVSKGAQSAETFKAVASAWEVSDTNISSVYLRLLSMPRDTPHFTEGVGIDEAGITQHLEAFML